MNNPYLLTAIASPIFIIMVIIGYYIFVPAEIRINYKHISKSRLMLGILPYGVSAYFIYVLVNSQALIRDILGLNPLLNYAKYIMMIEGDAVSYFQSFVSPTLTYILSFVYLMIFAFVMIFTFLLFVFSGNLKALQEYTIAFIIIYLVAFPFYIFFPVRVTGYTLSNISPLLYSLSPIVEQSLRFCDPNLDNCFPSLHAALTIMALLVVIFRTDIKSYKIFAWIATVSILFSILYLGIHWITDLMGGVLLAIVAYLIAAKYRSRILAISKNVVVAIERKFGIYESIVCTNCSSELRIYPHLGEFECPHCNYVMHFHPLTHAYKQRKSI